MKRTAFTLAFLSAAAAPAANADEIVHSGFLPSRVTNWSETALLDRFGEEPGRTLVEVGWELTAVTTSWAEIESLDSSAALIDLLLSTHLSMHLDGYEVMSMSPVESASFPATAFDGLIDFGGPSGVVVGPLESVHVASGLFSDLTPFLGEGQIGLTFEALGESFLSGPGNVIATLSTSSDVQWSIAYRYTQVPAPGGAALGALAIAASARRRRRSAASCTVR